MVERGEVAMTEATPPFFINEDDEPLFLVDRRFEFPISRPPQDFDFNLGVDDPAPFPRGPWLYEDDVTYELDWSLSNASDQGVEAAIVVDGINEFHEYTPGPEDFHQHEELHAIPAGGRAFGTIRDVEMREIAVDLATVVNGAPNSNLIVFERNHSQSDDRSQMFIPAVLPGLVGLRVGILSGEAADLVLEISVRATDFGGRIAERGDNTWELPAPQAFVPIVPEL